MPATALDQRLIHDPLFFQHRKDLPVMDEWSEGADILTFLAVLDRVHRDFDCALTPLQKPAVLAIMTFIVIPSSS